MKTAIYLGLKISSKWLEKYQDIKLIHHPMIKIIPRSIYSEEIAQAFSKFHLYTHIILTSQTAVHLFFSALVHFIPLFFRNGINLSCEGKQFIVVGKETSEVLSSYGIFTSYCAANETSEGICDLLDKLIPSRKNKGRFERVKASGFNRSEMGPYLDIDPFPIVESRELSRSSNLPLFFRNGINLSNSHFFWPNSSLSRQILPDYLAKYRIPFCQIHLYDTEARTPSNSFQEDVLKADELIFTSPSTVEAFLQYIPEIPWDKKITSIGPITHARLSEERNNLSCPK